MILDCEYCKKRMRCDVDSSDADLCDECDPIRTNFDRLASSVDEMAEAMVFEQKFQGKTPFWCFARDKNFNIGGSKHEAIAAAKEWLMEVEDA